MGAIALLVFVGIFGIASLIVMILKIKGVCYETKTYTSGTKKYDVPKYILYCLVPITLLFIMFFFFQFLVVIDEGETGVQVIFGSVVEQQLSPGINAKNPFADVYKYNIRLQEYTMSIVTGEGARVGNDGVMIRTSDNSEATIDATVWWAIDASKTFYIYKNISTGHETLSELVVRPSVRAVIRDVSSGFTLDALMTQRDELGEQILKSIKDMISNKGIIVDRVLIRSIIPPKEIDDAIKVKLSAEQQLQQKEFELEKAKKDAEIRRVNAQGIADAQEIIQKKLTPLYVQYEAIQTYKELANSNNTTFVIMPTTKDGAGMPLILGTN